TATVLSGNVHASLLKVVKLEVFKTELLMYFNLVIQITKKYYKHEREGSNLLIQSQITKVKPQHLEFGKAEFGNSGIQLGSYCNNPLGHKI
ncbi:hypothetical protein KI387_029477, partial [Taxus chinensis]